jgi:hypothetical protein
VNVKGSALRARVQWVQKMGPDAERTFMEALQPETRSMVQSCILVSDWYPFATFIELNTVIDRLFGKGDLALCKDLGRFACDVNLKTLYRLFFKLGSVKFIIGRCAAAWRVNYDHGEMHVAAMGDDWACLRVTGVPAPHRAHCLAVFGWIERATELSGGKVTRAVERCRLRGDPECEFELAWTT